MGYRLWVKIIDIEIIDIEIDIEVETEVIWLWVNWLLVVGCLVMGYGLIGCWLLVVGCFAVIG
jgi:hypothetical protein